MSNNLIISNDSEQSSYDLAMQYFEEFVEEYAEVLEALANS